MAPTFGALVKAELVSVPTLILVASSVGLALFMAIALGQQSETVPVSSFVLVIAAGAPPVLLIGPGIVSRLLTLGGFRLDADPDRLRIRTGLLTESRVAARRERLQQIQVERDPLHRLLGIERVRYETADIEALAGGAGGATRYLSPTGPPGQWRILAVEALGELQLDEAALEPVSPLIIRRTLIRFLLVTPLLAGAAFLIHPVLAIAASLGWVALGRWYARRRFAVIGLAVSGDQLLVRRGVLHQQLVLARLDKVQSLRLTASPTQRWLGLATLAVSTAGQGRRPVRVPDLPEIGAAALLDSLARRAATTPISDTL